MLKVWNPSSLADRAMKGRALGGLAASAFVLSLLVYIGVILWLDNVHIGTSNGMYKAI